MDRRYDQAYLSDQLEKLRVSIENNQTSDAINLLTHFLQLKPECTVTVENANPIQATSDMAMYINNHGSKSGIILQQPINPVPSHISQISMNTITSSNNTSGNLVIAAQSINDFNENIYNQLLKAGNSEANARYGATGTNSIREGVDKIKKRNK